MAKTKDPAPGTVLLDIKLPVDHHASKKNDKRAIIGHKGLPFIKQGRRSKAVRDAIMLTLARWKHQNPQHQIITTDVNMKALFYFPAEDFWNKDGSRCQTLIDVSNAYQMYEDCLQKAKLIKNDGLICSHDGSDRLAMEPGYKQPYAHIVLTARAVQRYDFSRETSGYDLTRLVSR